MKISGLAIKVTSLPQERKERSSVDKEWLESALSKTLGRKFLHFSCLSDTSFSTRSWKITRISPDSVGNQCLSKSNRNLLHKPKSTMSSRWRRRSCLTGSVAHSSAFNLRLWTPFFICQTTFLRKLWTTQELKLVKKWQNLCPQLSIWSKWCRCSHLNRPVDCAWSQHLKSRLCAQLKHRMKRTRDEYVLSWFHFLK